MGRNSFLIKFQQKNCSKNKLVFFGAIGLLKKQKLVLKTGTTPNSQSSKINFISCRNSFDIALMKRKHLTFFKNIFVESYIILDRHLKKRIFKGRLCNQLQVDLFQRSFSFIVHKINIKHSS